MAKSAKLTIEVGHADHGITDNAAAWKQVTAFLEGAPQGFFKISTHVEGTTVPNGMWGPEAGDEPVSDSECYYENRGNREWTDRLVDRPTRPTTLVQMIGIRDKDEMSLFTCYGGPLAPQNEADPNNADVQKSKDFWATHALCSGK